MDKAYHDSKKYEILKKVNIYEHDLRSGRPFPEFDFPQQQGYDKAVNLTNWDLFLYTRSFYSMDTEFQLAMRHQDAELPHHHRVAVTQILPIFAEPQGAHHFRRLEVLGRSQVHFIPVGE